MIIRYLEGMTSHYREKNSQTAMSWKIRYFVVRNKKKATLCRLLSNIIDFNIIIFRLSFTILFNNGKFDTLLKMLCHLFNNNVNFNTIYFYHKIFFLFRKEKGTKFLEDSIFRDEK